MLLSGPFKRPQVDFGLTLKMNTMMKKKFEDVSTRPTLDHLEFREIVLKSARGGKDRERESIKFPQLLSKTFSAFNVFRFRRFETGGDSHDVDQRRRKAENGVFPHHPRPRLRRLESTSTFLIRGATKQNKDPVIN